MRVILFIGHHKVGSTSLQDFLARNAVPLARAGILYPAVDFEAMAAMLANAVTGKSPGDILPINVREPHNALAFRMLAAAGKGKIPPIHTGLPSSAQMVRAIRKQVEFLNPQTVILAAEVFANFAPASTDLITELAGIFPQAEFTIITTLRRIDTYLASWHGQRLKFGHKIAPLRDDGLQEYFGNIHFDYRLMLEGWTRMIPDAKFILRDYTAVREAGGSIPDFITQAGLTLPRGLAPEQKTNESFHRGIYEIARRGNHSLSPPQARQLRRFLRQQTPHLDLPPSAEIEMFGADNRRRMAERFESVHQFLGELSGKVPFFADQAEVAIPLPVPEMDVFRHALAGAIRGKGELEDPVVRDFLTTLAGD